MPTTAIESYNNFDHIFSQGRRLSGPYINPLQSLQQNRRYSVQTDGSQSISQPLSSMQSMFCMQKQPLRNVLSAPIQQVGGVLPRRDSLKSVSEATSEVARYKTELCRPFEETGHCRYGTKCQFAHGVQEIRSLNRHPKYKTELCRTFHTTGFCSYGQRCNFIHNDEERKSSPTSPTSSVGSRSTSRGLSLDFPLTINSTGDSPASSINGGSPSLSPCYLNEDVFATTRLSPTSSVEGNLYSGNMVSPPGSPNRERDVDVNVRSSPLDLGLEIALFRLAL